jgi:hypothetical protein
MIRLGGIGLGSFKAGMITYEEEQLARSVFGDQLPYGQIWLGNRYLLGQSVPITIATDVRGKKANYVICWGDPNVYNNGADHGDQTRATFIHELTHVWQGHHGYTPVVFMVESVAAQGWNGVKDIYKQGRYSGWDNHRNKTYVYSMNDIGKPWSSFNVEQQGNIVEDWFKESDEANADGEIIKGGNMSILDPRYPYIRDNIRAGKPDAAYVPFEVHRISEIPQKGKIRDFKEQPRPGSSRERNPIQKNPPRAQPDHAPGKAGRFDGQ